MDGNRRLVKKLLFVVNTPEFFLSHRLTLAEGARAAGYDVHIASAGGEDAHKLRRLGFVHHTVGIVRSGQNPFQEVASLLSLYRLFLRLKPDLVHLITIKPILYGGIAARLSGVQSVVAAVSGLGVVFAESPARYAKVRRWLVARLYRLAFGHPRLGAIFQNPDDRDVLLNLGALKPEQVRMIRGSGVHLQDYPCLPEPEGRPVVVMAARLLRDKGVFEFVEAASLLKSRATEVNMRLIGTIDPGNPTSATEIELRQWQDKGTVELLGYRTDIAAQYAAANIVCLPSYREGLPKGLVEAAACGRAVITTDVPGCRDAIEPGVTGILVPPRQPDALADAIQALIEAPERRARMGRSGRALAEQAFAIEKVLEEHLAIYRELLADE